jgi:surface protein
MFRGATSFNQNISGWNVSNVTVSMQSIFEGATSFNQNLSAWNVSNVTNMRSMFAGATSFTAAGLNQWTPTTATLMDNMFDGTSAAYTNTTSSGLFLTDLSGWPSTASKTDFFSPNGTTDTTLTDPKSPFYLYKGTSMVLTFSGTPTITLPIRGAIGTVQVDYGNGTRVSSLSGTVSGLVKVYGNFTEFGENGWADVTKLQSVISWPSTLTNLSYAFMNAWLLTSVPSTLPSSVTRLESTFRRATSFNQDLSTWNTVNVTYMGATFMDAIAFNGNISGWNVSNVTDMGSMFYRNRIEVSGQSTFNQNLSGWNVSKVQTMGRMFLDSDAFTATGLNQWNPIAATYLGDMFNGTSAAYTNTSSSGLFLTDLTSWPSTATAPNFFSPNRSTDTTTTDPKSPFFTGVSGSTMTLKISPTGGSTVTFGDFPRGNITVYWGDGNSNSYGSTGTITHNYNAGTYYISIVGGISSFRWSSEAPSQGINLLTRIVYWNCNFQFYYAENLTSVPSFLPASATDLNFGLTGARKLNQNLSGWNVSNVRFMKCFFQDCTLFTAEGLDQWNLSSCIYLEAMFNGTSAAYTNTTSSGRFITNLSGWITKLPANNGWSPNPNNRSYFFSPDGATDTSSTDPKSPFFGL